MLSKGKSMLTPEKDNRIKMINERINFVEKHFGDMCTVFGAYTRKLGRYRDKHDELARIFQVFSEEEPFNKTTATALDSATKGITFLADYMDIEVQRLESKIINQIFPYENLCRSTRESLKAAILVRDKELAREKQLTEIRNKFSANTSAADSELLKAKVKVNRTNKDVDNVIESFEKRKLRDIKTILSDFVAIEMKHHAKALEILTATYQDINDIDEKIDFQEFKRALKARGKFSTEHRKRSQSLESVGIPRSLSSQNTKLSRSSRNIAAASATSYTDSENSEDDDDIDNDTNEERLPAPDQESEESDSSENSTSNDDEVKLSARPNKTSQPLTRVPVFKKFCEGADIPESGSSVGIVTPNSSRSPRSIQVKSINGIFKQS